MGRVSIAGVGSGASACGCASLHSAIGEVHLLLVRLT